MTRRAARVDENQPGIVRGLLAIGCSVTSLAPLGDGVPDLLVGYRRRSFLMEVKGAPGPRGGLKGRNLTPDQVRWHEEWRGAPVYVVRTLDEALDVVQGRRDG